MVEALLSNWEKHFLNSTFIVYIPSHFVNDEGDLLFEQTVINILSQINDEINKPLIVLVEKIPYLHVFNYISSFRHTMK